MVQSMTGYSRLQYDVADTVFCWELKSVNHRYLDCSFRLPEMFRFLEPSLRECLRGKLHRGKIDCSLKIIELGPEFQKITINESMVKSLLAVGRELSDKHQIANDLTVSQILNKSDMLQVSATDTEKHVDILIGVFNKAVQELITVRQSEGSALKGFIKSRIKSLDEEVLLVSAATDDSRKNAREKLLRRLDDLNLSVADSRIEQEIALIIARLDVSEEIDRLKAHLHEVLRVLESNSEPVGKRLDFLMQELNREANTLSSKSDTFAVTNHAVELKILVEQMREQTQNIE